MTTDLATPRRDHIAPLDGLRGLAVLMVLWAHAPRDVFFQLGNAPGQAMRMADFIFQPGHFGVDVFFVLSGFLITRILLYDKHRGTPLMQFIFRRFLRIFPIYYLLILILLFIVPGMYLLWTALYVSNFTFSYDLSANPLRHTWSLCVEEHFYLFWPLVIWCMTVASVRRLVVYFMVPVAFVMSLVLTATHSPQLMEGVFGFSASQRAELNQALPLTLIYRTTPFRMASLAIGGLIAIHESRFRDRRGYTLRVALMVAVPAIAIIGVAGAVKLLGRLEPYEYAVEALKFIGFSLASTTVMLLVIALNDRAGWLRTAMSVKVLPGIGRISYGLYLYHYPIYMALGVLHYAEGHEPTLQRCLLAAGVSVLAAWVSYVAIEKPILSLKHKVNFERKPEPAPAG